LAPTSRAGASDDAYRDLESGLARVGPLGAAPGMSKLVVVRFGDMTVHKDFAVAALRWEATGPGGALFPALDADIKLTPAGDDATVLAISGVDCPPEPVAPGQQVAAQSRPGTRSSTHCPFRSPGR